MFLLPYQFSKPLKLDLSEVTGTLSTLLSSVLDENKLLNQGQSGVSRHHTYHKRRDSRRGTLRFFLVWSRTNSITFLGLHFPVSMNTNIMPLQAPAR